MSSTETGGPDKSRILIVDDDRDLLVAIKRNLRKKYTIDIAEDGKEALTVLNGHSYAVVVSDKNMPMMDGVMFLSKAREIAPSATRIMMTGDADMESAIEAVNQGNIFQFVVKPCKTEMLDQILQAAVNQHNLHKRAYELEQENNQLKSTLRTLEEKLAMLQSN